MDRTPRHAAPGSGRWTARTVALTITLAALWVVLSGQFVPLLFFWGALCVALSVILAVRMGLIDDEGFPLQLAKPLSSYMPWLAREIIKSNIDVAKIILNPKLPISPLISSFRVTPQTELGRVIYANSITLTPGTITAGIVGDTFEVHALTREAWNGTEEGEMGRRVCRVEGTA